MLEDDHYDNSKKPTTPVITSLKLLKPTLYKNCIWPHCIVACPSRHHKKKRHFCIFGRQLKVMHRLNKRYLRNNPKKDTIMMIESLQPQPTIDLKQWIPPINYDTLRELSVKHIFKSLQLRHDLLFDANLSFRPNLDGPAGREKRKKADRYWRHVERALEQSQFEVMKPILQELVKIATSLMSPFDGSPASGTSFTWPWPSQITKQHLVEGLDADLMVQQLKHGSQIDMEWLVMVLTALCPTVQRVELMQRYFSERRYAKALKQCFCILEMIKLDCANRVLRHYRNFLLETCAELEYRCFMKQCNKQELKLDSVYTWLHSSFRRQKNKPSFKQIYYPALVHLMTEDEETRRAFDLATTAFPITLQFEQRRLTSTFRFEFQNMMVVAVMLIPYRHLTGKKSAAEDMEVLKQSYTKLIKEAPNDKVSCYKLAYFTCQRAMMQREQALDQATVKFWETWASQHLEPRSPIFKLIYSRVCQHLVHFAEHGSLLDNNLMQELEVEITQLGKKLKLLADLNLETFGSLYKYAISTL